MPASSLPARASVEFLRKQSKHLHKAFRDGDADAVARIREHLQRAGQLPEDEVPAMDLSLQEVQHSLACEYGFGKWEELLAAVDVPPLEELHRLSDRDAQVLLRESDVLDSVHVLAVAPERVREKFLSNTSDRVRAYLQSEIEFVRDPKKKGEAARERFFRKLSELRASGQLTWPPREDSPPVPSPGPGDRAPELARAAGPLLAMGRNELSDTLLGLANLARREGVLAMEPLTREGPPTLLTEAIMLIVDGTEPALVADMLEIRATTILRNRTLRGHMAIDGWMSIHSGDNPVIVEHKLSTYFLEEPALEWTPRREPTLDEMIAFQRDTPASRMAQPQMVEFFRDMAFLARQQGICAVAPLADHVDDRSLAAGMRQAVHDDPESRVADRVIDAMETQLHQERVDLHWRHCFVIKGIIGIQAGRKPEDIVAAARKWADEQAAELASAPCPRPTTPL